MHLEVGYIPQADFGSEEETVLSPPDQFAEEDASSLDVTLGQQATVSFTERPPNEVEEEAETLNSIPVPAPESCSFLLLVIAIFFAVAFAAMFGVLVFSTYKRVLEFSRKRRSFVLLFCSVAFIHLGVQEFAWRFGSLHHGTALNPAA